MKLLLNFLIIFFPGISEAQNRIEGKYNDYFGYTVEINIDSTFDFNWRFDLFAYWCTGKWTIINDTIYFDKIPVYDTLLIVNKNGQPDDSLILSNDKKPGLITTSEMAINSISSGGQDLLKFPGKLFYRNNRLYQIWNGKVVKKKVRGFWTNKKYPPWFVKESR